VFATPFEVRGSAFVLHASIGIALYSVSNESEIDLLKKADLAMYSAKDAGQELLPVLFAAVLASRRSPDEVGTATARRAGRRINCSSRISRRSI
jgi:GGDEF domain-containing protein